MSVITGAAPVTTFTVLFTVLLTLPAESVFLYESIYVPRAPVFTLPLPEITPDPSTASVHVAQRSVYVDQRLILTLDEPFSVTTGAILSATITFLVTVGAVFELLSVTSYESIYVPGVLISTDPLVTILKEISPSWRSIAVAPGST